jgi:hypothetical protein
MTVLAHGSAACEVGYPRGKDGIRWLVVACLATLASVTAPAALALEDQRLDIGSLSGLKRPDGFVVEDLRTEAMKTPSREQTYRRPFQPFKITTGPVAKYRHNIGAEAFNISPVDLLAEKLIQRYGDRVAGKKLVVREFSIAILETIERDSVMTPYSPGVSPGAAVAGAVLGNALVQAIHGPGRSSRLEVRIVAELDGKPLAGSDFIGVVPGTVRDQLPKVVAGTIDYTLHKFEEARAEEATEQAKQTGNAGPTDTAAQPVTNSEQVETQSQASK